MPTRAKPHLSPLQGVDWPTEPFFKAVLYDSAGINESYGVSMSRFYGKEALQHFKLKSHLILNNAGVRIGSRKSIPELEGHYQDWEVILFIQNFNVRRDEKVPLALTIDFYYPSRRNDEDGGIKSTQDAVCDYLGVNDNTVVDLHIRKFVDKEKPRCEISMRVCTERINQP